MESSLPCLTREQRFPLLALRPCEPRLVSPLGCTCTWNSVYGTRAGRQPAPSPLLCALKVLQVLACLPRGLFVCGRRGRTKGRLDWIGAVTIGNRNPNRVLKYSVGTTAQKCWQRSRTTCDGPKGAVTTHQTKATGVHSSVPGLSTPQCRQTPRNQQRSGLRAYAT